MSNYTITGRLCHIGPEERKSEKFTVRMFWIETQDRYPQTLAFQLSQDRCAYLDRFAIGDEVQVHFDLQGRTWTDGNGITKCFNTLSAWKLDHANPEQEPRPAPASLNLEPTPEQKAHEKAVQEPLPNIGAENEPDDLPF